ncbi:hypothetical protein V3C99_019149, partial [Haemonchus contortus]
VLARGIPFLSLGSFVERSDHNLTAVLMLVWHPEVSSQYPGPDPTVIAKSHDLVPSP